MAPLLLDRRSLIKSGLYLCLLFAIVFSAGYYSGYTKGYDRAESILRQQSPVALVLPDPAYTDAEAFEPQPPDVIEPGAEIDVDRPDEASAEAVMSEPGDAEAAATAIEPDTGKPGAPVQLATLEFTPGIAALSAQPQEKQAGNASVSALASNASVTEAKYSIQVGMYGSADNAEQLVETLNASSLDAYIDEFNNTKHEPRFNVRFGYYRDRASAKAALKAYRSQLVGEGYVVRVKD